MLLTLYALLTLALLVLTAAGAEFYSSAVAAQNRHRAQRSALAFVQSQAAAFETGVTLQSGEEGNVLCLREPEGSYETRIYYYDGALRTQLCGIGDTLRPEAGERICDLQSFALEWAEDGLLRITADGRTAYAYCGGGEDVG